jgi:hypothetical protein
MPAAAIGVGVSKRFGPAGKIFKEWLAFAQPDRRLWRELPREGIGFVAR